ncbi:MAG: hypothetical protein PW788_02435 [Micavibrio sp.]|nr:hypothetical protein [Micavibrio sp.]
MPNQAWEDAIPLMQQQLDLILVEGDKSVVPDGVRDYFKKIQAEGWDNNRLVLTYGRLDVDRLIPLCREGIVPWWVPLTGKALDNALEDLQKLSAAFKEDVGNKDVSNIYTALLTWLAYPDVMKVQGYPRKFNADIVRHVLQQGADPNNDNGSWLMRALNQLPADCISPFIEYGAAPAAVQEAMETMEQQKKIRAAGCGEKSGGR